MPDMEGVEVLSELRESNKSARVFIVTDEKSISKLNAAKTLGITGILKKPLKDQELKRVVYYIDLESQ